jgi:hypothetical protein
MGHPPSKFTSFRIGRAATRQNFLARHPDYPYIVYNDLPKLRELQKEFPALYR